MTSAGRDGPAMRMTPPCGRSRPGAVTAKRRGGGTAQGESRISPGGPGWDEAAIERVVGEEPTPEFAAQVAEEYQRLLDRLGDDTLRRVAVWKMEGLTNGEVAGKLGCSRRTVARKLETIRIIWNGESAP